MSAVVTSGYGVRSCKCFDLGSAVAKFRLYESKNLWVFVVLTTRGGGNEERRPLRNKS